MGKMLESLEARRQGSFEAGRLGSIGHPFFLEAAS